jgi:DNA-binding transcriptional MerR regulator
VLCFFFYRNNPNLLLHELKGFQAPGFMLKKIRAYASQMRTDRQPEEQKTDEKDDLCETPEASFAVINMTESC